MANEFLGEAALARLIELIKLEFQKYFTAEEAEQLLAALDGKLDKATYPGVVYANNVSGTGQAYLAYSTGKDGGSLARRQSTGALAVGDAVNPSDAVPLAQMNEALEGKLDKVNARYRVYATDGNGEQITYAFSATLTKSSVPFRKTNGEIETGTAIGANDAVPLAQLNTILDERIGDISDALDSVIALQEAIISAQNDLIGGAS